jgi:hypothetical protein
MISDAIRSMRGRWRPRDSSVVVEISVSHDQVNVCAVDIDDGEELEVGDLSWSEECIAFTMITPSTKWTVYQELRLQVNGSLLCKTTILDHWERAS